MFSYMPISKLYNLRKRGIARNDPNRLQLYILGYNELPNEATIILLVHI